MHISEKSQKLASALFNGIAVGSTNSIGNIYVEKAQELLKQDGFDFQLAEDHGPFSMMVFEHNSTNEQIVILYSNSLAMIDQNGQEIGYPLIMHDGNDEVEYLADYIAEKLWQDKTKSTGPKMYPSLGSI